MKKFNLKIISPEGIIFDDEVAFVVSPGEKGNFGVLPRHTPLVTSLVRGIVRIQQEDKNKENELIYIIESGIAEVDINHNLKLLVDQTSSYPDEKTARGEIDRRNRLDQNQARENERSKEPTKN